MKVFTVSDRAQEIEINDDCKNRVITNPFANNNARRFSRWYLLSSLAKGEFMVVGLLLQHVEWECFKLLLFKTDERN
jgi:hypothetical protein